VYKSLLSATQLRADNEQGQTKSSAIHHTNRHSENGRPDGNQRVVDTDIVTARQR
jgi:hypothetical protein